MTRSKHGTHSRYVQGCRCRPCTDARAAYMREWRARRAPRDNVREKVAPAVDETPGRDTEPTTEGPT